jgi:oligopeptide transport system ATP-binding protein
VIYAGYIVESGTTEEIFTRPGHPCTIGLMASVPRLDLPRSVRLVPIEGQPPDLALLDRACSYRPRCRFAIRRCAESSRRSSRWARAVAPPAFASTSCTTGREPNRRKEA